MTSYQKFATLTTNRQTNTPAWQICNDTDVNKIGLAGTGNIWKNVVAVQNVIRPKMNRDKVMTGPNPIWSIDQMATPNANYTEPWQKQFTHTVVTCLVTRTLRQLSYQPHRMSTCRDMNWKRKTVCSKVCRISVNGRKSLGIDEPLLRRRTTQATRVA